MVRPSQVGRVRLNLGQAVQWRQISTNYAEKCDFVLYPVGPAGTNARRRNNRYESSQLKRISQRGAMFSPHVLPVVAGTTVERPNFDEMLLNVLSRSETKPVDLDLSMAPVVKWVTLDQPGRGKMFCSIHKAMSCVLLV